ncbi:MAG: DUF58 domain-containing protein [Deltaproteobacteria bacterium]|nr:DUF58 domain-containing protein [Deltaproteobacteria bacterium]
MIVPRTKLLAWTGVVAIPFSAAAAVAPSVAPVSLAAILGFLVLALLDAALSYGGLDAVSVELPPVVRLLKGRRGALGLRFGNADPKAVRLRLGLAFPRGITSEIEELTAELRGGAETVRLEWPCTPLARGVFNVDACHLERASILGFWGLRAVRRAQTEIRVYPDMLPEQKRLGAIFLDRGSLGVHARRQAGRGREFEKLREYVAGDCLKEIHWKATAKRGRPFTKVFQIERTQEVYVIVDASRLSARPASGGDDILERYVTAALILGQVAHRQGDLFGLLTFSDRIHGFIRARGGHGHYRVCRDALYTVRPRVVTPDFEELAGFIRSRIRRRALLVFLTGLDDPVLSEGFIRGAEILRQKHLMLVNMLKPPLASPLFSDEDVVSPDDLYAKLAGHLKWCNLRELEKVLRQRGIRFHLLDHERLCAQIVSQYMDIKRRLLL